MIVSYAPNWSVTYDRKLQAQTFIVQATDYVIFFCVICSLVLSLKILNSISHPFTKRILTRLKFRFSAIKNLQPSPFNISFSFNHTFHFVYKYHVPRFNESVFNWTFCQLLHLKTQLHKTSVCC